MPVRPAKKAVRQGLGNRRTLTSFNISVVEYPTARMIPFEHRLLAKCLAGVDIV